MIKKRPSMKNLMIRRNAEIFKVLFEVRVHKVFFPYRVPIDSDSEISCCFERGGKICPSMDTLPTFSDDDESCEVVFEETLSLVATLYKCKSSKKDVDGTFQSKPACLVVRAKKKAARRGQMYQALGVVEVDLSTFMHPAGGAPASTEHSFPLTKSFINGAYLHVTITPKVASGDEQDDTMSMQSGFSDAPVMSADFDIGSIPRYPAALSSPEKVIEEESEEEEKEVLAIELHRKTVELDNLRGDHAHLRADLAQCSRELEAASESLVQATAREELRLQDQLGESESARAARVALTRILAESSLMTPEDTVGHLKAETAALFAELEAQRQVQSALSRSLQVKASRLTEAEARNLLLLGKVNQLEDRNVSLKAHVEASLPRIEYEQRCREKENEYRLQVTELQATKEHTEAELNRQIEACSDLKRRLQLYSENVAELEVSGVAGHTGTSAAEGRPRKVTVEESQVVTHEGSLTKRGSFYPSWKNRHFVLHGDAHLSYYTNKEDMVFKGHFVLTKDTVLGQAKVSGHECFYLEHSKRRLYMTAASTLEAMEWEAVFRRSIAALNEK